MSKKRKKKSMSACDALDLVDDSIGDGAAMFLASEMAGMDYEDFCAELASEEPTK